MSISKFLIRRLQALFVLAASMLMCLHASAYSFSQDGIYYNITSSTDQTVAVTYQSYSGGGRYSEPSYTSGYSGSVTIPASVEYNGVTYTVSAIGSHAFDDADITSISLPNTITEIGVCAFNYCQTLQSIQLPNSLVKIGAYAFCGTKISSITIPSSVTSIGDDAFEYSYINSIDIPSSVTSIGKEAFCCCWELTSISIPQSITSIESRTFFRCPKLESVTIPSSVKNIDSEAFAECKSLTAIAIPSSVITIGYNAFNYCSGLTKAEFASIESLCNIEFGYYGNPLMYAKHLYINGEEVTSVTIPSSVTHINQYAFSGCQDLETLIIESDALMNQEFSSSLNIGTIFHCGINNLIIGDGITQIPQYAFYSGANAASITFSSTLKAIGNYAFQGHSALSSITIPSSVNSIGEYAFSGCNGLTDVTIPSSVNSIGVNAFDKCTELTTVTIESNEVMNQEFNYSYNLGKLFGAQVENYIIGNGVNQISSSAFYSCDAMSSVSISSSVTSIESGAFYGNNHLTKAEFASIESLCNIDFGSYDANPLYYAKHLYINGIEQTSVVIPSSVTRIGNGAFYGYSGLISISSTSSIESIGNYAFSACNSLTELPYLSSLTTIGSGAFRSCSGLTSIVLPSSLVSLGDYAFEDCYALKDVTIDSNTLMSKDFAYNNNLKNIFGEQVENYIIGDKVKQIPNYTFSGCTAVTSVTLPSSVNSIGNDAFYWCQGLTSIAIPSSVNNIGEYAFYNCNSLTDINIPASVTSIGSNAFGGCYNLVKAEFDSIEKLCSIRFEDSYSNPLYSAHHLYIDGEKQTSVTIPSSVVSIGNYAFINCDDMTSISIPSSVISIGESAFYGCTGLTKAEFASIESLCNTQFDRWASNPLNYAHHLYIDGTEQTSVNIPSSVTNIGDCTFCGCSGLTSVTIPSSVTSIGIAAFAGCTGLTSIIIPPSVNFINGAAFSATGIISIEIPESVTELVGDLFAGCSNLTSVTLPSTINNIGYYNFRDCPNLKLLTVKATTPPTIYAYGTDVFPNYDITLCVPYNCRYIYAQTSPWNNFWNIKELTCEHSFTSIDNHDGTHSNSCSICGTIEAVAHNVVNGICVNCGATPDTEITDIANTIYFDNCNAFCGEPLELSIKMKNDIAATGFQFDIILPEGITALQDEDGLYEIELSTERTTAAKTNTFGSSLMPDGSIRVLAASTHNYAFTGNDGEVCVIKLNIGEDVPEGEYPIIIKNIEISDNKSLAYTQDYVKSTLTIISYISGDANGDNKITVTDFTAVANAILGNVPANYVAKAADVNSDGKVTVSDLTGIANIILYGSVNPSSNAKSRVGNTYYAPEVYVPAFCIEPNSTIEVPVYINNGTTSFSAYQMDINLPQGLAVSDIRIVEDRISNHILQGAIMEEGAYRLLSYSTRGNEFMGNNGAVAVLTISADDIALGDMLVRLARLSWLRMVILIMLILHSST